MDPTVLQAQQGSSEAFSQLYSKHRPMVSGLCLKMTKSSTDAEDLTQDVFLHLFKRIGQFKGESLFKTWLYRMTTNVVLMKMRKNKLQDARATIFEIGNVDVADVRKTDSDLHVDLVRMMSRLPKGYRSSFIRHAIHGKTHKEISSETGASLGCSKSQTHKACQKMREFMEAK